MKALLGEHLSAWACLSALLALPYLATAQTPSATTPTRPARARAVPNSSGVFFHEGGAQLPAYPVVVREETPSARAARMKWFQDARFGLFIHWGVYAVPARGEWYMNNAKIPQSQYRPYAKKFTAANYDPQAWAALAKEAGVKYVVLTAKHHDGFTLYDSAVSDWNAVKASGCRARPDPAAGRRRAEGGHQVRPVLFAIAGLEQPGRRHRQYPALGRGAKERRFRRIPGQDRTAAGQGNPGQISALVPLLRYRVFHDPRARRPIFDLTCQYPDLIINNRLGGGVLGDTATPEQRIATDPLGRQFEVCMTINNSWGYNAGDTRWKSCSNSFGTSRTSPARAGITS